MVQILQRAEDPTERIGKLLGGIADTAADAYLGSKSRKKTEADRAQLEQQYGMKLSSNPDIMKLQIQAAEKERQKDAGFKRRLSLAGFGTDEGEDTPNIQDQNNPYTPKIEIDADVNDLVTSKPKIEPKEAPFKPPYSQKDIAIAMAEEPAMARIMNDQNAAAQRTYDKKLDRALEEKKHIHGESKKYYENLMDNVKEAEAANRSLERQKNLVGKVGFWDRIATIFNPKVQTLLQSKDAAALESNIAEQIASKKNKLGGILTTAKLNLLLSKMVTSAKTEEANRYIIDYNMLENDITIAEGEIANEIIRENKGYRPPGFQAEVNKRLKAQFADKADELFDKIESLEDDPEQLKKVWRRKVPQGTPMNAEIVKKYREMFGPNAKKEAQADGYDTTKN